MDSERGVKVNEQGQMAGIYTRGEKKVREK
jgi:hypothetical protein